MSDEQLDLIDKWLHAIHLRTVAIYAAGFLLFCTIPAVLMDDWVGVVSLMGAGQIVVWITGAARKRQHEEMERHGFGGLIPSSTRR